jgi:ABC-2 type transport system permease protein
MARALFTLTVKDLRLLLRDPGALLLLFLAPLVVISAAGFSLSSLYRSSRHLLPVVDLDRGPVGEKLLTTLRKAPELEVALVEAEEARRLVSRRPGQGPRPVPEAFPKRYAAGEL